MFQELLTALRKAILHGGLLNSATEYLRCLLRAEIERLAHGYDRILERSPSRLSGLFEGLPLPKTFSVSPQKSGHAELLGRSRVRQGVVFHGALNYADDLKSLLETESRDCQERLTIFLTGFSPYLLSVSSALSGGKVQSSNFITLGTLTDVAHCAGFDVTRVRNVGFLPWTIFDPLNSLLSTLPLLRRLGLASVVVLRRREKTPREELQLSVLVPVRNEAGNIAAAKREILQYPEVKELLFIEGNSQDQTWKEIEKAKAEDETGKIRVLKQSGIGKWDAVITGIEAAEGHSLIIVDGDLTVPPSELSRFIEALANGHGDFINGDRLVYPMEEGAMRPLNRLGNIFFAKWVGMVIDVPIGDSLCGTKLMWIDDVRRFLAWQRRFGKKDPFGDFSLLFAAGSLGYKFVDVPIHYKARTYGATNIRRFRDGFLLAVFTFGGLFSVRAGARKGYTNG